MRHEKKITEKMMEGKIMRKMKKVIPAVSGCLMSVMLMGTTCLAATGTDAVTKPLENLKTLVIAVIGAVGVIILAKNVMEFAQAYQQQDSSTMNSALKGIVAGVMMAGISTVLSFLGF
ncbi:MAG: electron transporter RnfA [Lachnospiraceae bacterium]|nr:electron transporter RnfA [Lachnospiraceae bacterium]